MSLAVRRPIILAASSRGKRWRQRAWLSLLMLVSVLLQGSLFPALGVGWFRPDLLLIIVVYWNATRGAGEGWLVALLGGFLSDVFSAGRLGLGAVSLAASVRLALALFRSFHREHLGTKVAMVAATSLLASLCYYGLLLVFRIAPPFPWAWKEAIVPHLWQTALVAPLWWWVAEKIIPDSGHPSN